MRVLGPIALACLLGCVAPDKPLVPEGPGIPEYVPTDVTFYAFGDPQYGGGADDKNDFQVTALNGVVARLRARPDRATERLSRSFSFGQPAIPASRARSCD